MWSREKPPHTLGRFVTKKRLQHILIYPLHLAFLVLPVDDKMWHFVQVYITDILGSNRRRQTCNFLQILYDPDNKVADQILDKGSLHTERLCAARRPPSGQTCIESHSL